MKRTLSCFLLLAALFSLCLSLPSGAYTRISYGADCLASSAELCKSGLRGREIVFSEADFRQALGLSRIDNITILSLPDAAAGTLKLRDSAVVVGQMLGREDIPSLVFAPASDTVDSAAFTFCANSAAGTTAVRCTLKVLDQINEGPTVTGAALEVSTRADVSVYGQLSATDPEGDALRYLMVSYPKKGTLRLSEESGLFRYTPMAGMTGTDSFSYVVRDGYGNYSGIATVRVEVTARGDSRVFADMTDSPAHNAALTLAEKNVMIGEIAGDGLYFCPTGTLTRADFLVMAMKCAGVRPADGVTRTWFDDDDKIADPVRPYVATAQLYGYVTGDFDGNGLYFSPDKTVTRAEAAVILNRLLGLSTPAVLPTVKQASAIPVWARSSVYALRAAGILGDGVNGATATGALTREEAASALYAVLCYRSA